MLKFSGARIAFVLLFSSILILTGCSKSGDKPAKNTTTLAITSLSVNTGPFTTEVTITGTGFSTIVANNKVFFNGVAATVKYANATTIATSVPLAAGTGNVTVNVDGNTATGSIFTYQQTEVVSVVAGSGDQETVDGVGTDAHFQQLSGIAVDSSGFIYVADENAHRIRKITPAGVVTTFAGSGESGFADGTGTSARFSHPSGITADKNGNIYVADAGNSLIRKITRAGVVTTLAGKPGTSISVDGTGLNASFSTLEGIVADPAGNLFVVDHGGSMVRKITPTGVVTTLAKEIDADGIAIDKTGNLFVTSTSRNHIYKITQTGVTSLFAGNNSTLGIFYYPKGIVVNTDGNIYVTDGNGITKITPQGVTSIFATGRGYNIEGPLNSVMFPVSGSLTANATGDLYITELSRVEKISYQ